MREEEDGGEERGREGILRRRMKRRGERRRCGEVPHLEGGPRAGSERVQRHKEPRARVLREGNCGDAAPGCATRGVALKANERGAEAAGRGGGRSPRRRLRALAALAQELQDHAPCRRTGQSRMMGEGGGIRVWDLI